MNNQIVENDLNDLLSIFEFCEQLRGKSILITGGTGLIGSLILKFLDKLAQNGVDINIYGTSRSQRKADLQCLSNHVKWIIQDMTDSFPDIHFDYIIHTACPTQSSFLVNFPVEVIQDSLIGAKNVFDFAREHHSSVIYLSSIEIYGQKFEDEKTSESGYGYLDQLNPRSCYPESKRLIECMASAYAKEYDVDIKCARLTQTFGAGIREDDNRVFAQFARSALYNKDIILHTEGKSSKSYVYTTDAINALFYILFKGEKGTAYNVANEESYISIYDLACFIRNNFNEKINVCIELDSTKGYAPDTKVNLDTTELRKLGWHAHVELREMFSRLIDYLR